MALRDVKSYEPQPCKVARLLTELDDDDRATLEEWMATKGAWPIAQSLSKYGYPISEQIVKKHQNGTCCCLDAQ